MQLEGLGIYSELHLAYPEHRSEREEKLRDKNLLIICGGDGTIHNVLPDAVRAHVPVGILPAGTANVLARELGIPNNLEKAITILGRGRKRTLRLGRANGKYFHLMAGIGADGYIINQVGLSLKRFLGVAAFWVTGISRFWGYPLQPFRVEFDLDSHVATFAVISNARYYGGHLLLTPHASVFEDQLDVCLFTSNNHVRFLSYLWGSLRGKHLSDPDVIYKEVGGLEGFGEPSVHVQLDGEVAGTLPMKFVSSEDHLQVVVP
jgi:YegS/Rv2252/BmrU family lipid kinase